MPTGKGRAGKNGYCVTHGGGDRCVTSMAFFIFMVVTWYTSSPIPKQ